MVPAVAVVVAQYPPIVNCANQRINVGEAALNHCPALKPDLLFENRPASFAREIRGLINPLLRLEEFLFPLTASLLNVITGRMQIVLAAPVEPPRLRT